MNDQESRYKLAVGFFVLASIIFLAVLITLFGGFPNYLKQAKNYSLVFGNAQGISPGTPVLRSGVKIGEVRAVTLDNVTGKVDVKIQVADGYFLRRGDRATLVRGFLGGDAAIAFVPGSDDPKKLDTTPVEPGAVLEGYNQADASLLLQKTAELVPPAQEALVEIRKVAESLNRMTPAMDEAVRDLRDFARAANRMTPLFEETLKDVREIAKAGRQIAPDLQKTSEELRLLSKQTREAVPELRRTNEEVQLTVRTWGRVGERVDVLLATNELKVNKLVDQLGRSADRLDEALKRTLEVLSEENRKNLTNTLRNTSVASERFDPVMRGTEDLLRDTRLFLKQMNESLLRADAVLTDIQKSTRPFGERSPIILRNLEESTEKLNRTLTDVRDLVQVVARSEGTIQKLLSDPTLYNNLSESACMLTRVLPRVDRILRDVEIFADKIARHPEALGIGGAVRPSSGLKEAPSYPWRTVPAH